MKIKLSIFLNDQGYQNRLANYFNVHYADKIELAMFSSAGVLEKYIAEQAVDILLLDEGEKQNTKHYAELNGSMSIIILTEKAGNDTQEGLRCVFKYQKAELIYQEIVNVFSECRGSIIGVQNVDSKKRRAAVYAFLPTNGGAGATTVACAFCNCFSKNGKVLYLNFEEISTTGIFMTGEGNYDFEEILYGLKNKRGILELKLESAVRKNAYGTYFFEGCKNQLSMQDITEEDIEKLFSTLKTQGSYDLIIADLSSGINRINQAVLEQAEVIVAVSDGTAVSQNKFTRMLCAYEAMKGANKDKFIDKISVFYNKYQNKNFMELNEKRFPVVGRTMRVDSISEQETVNRLMEMDVFKQIGQWG